MIGREFVQRCFLTTWDVWENPENAGDTFVRGKLVAGCCWCISRVAGIFLQLQMHTCVYYLLTLKLCIPGKGSPRHGASASSLHLSLGDFPIRTGSFCGNDHLVKTSSS